MGLTICNRAELAELYHKFVEAYDVPDPYDIVDGRKVVPDNGLNAANVASNWQRTNSNEPIKNNLRKYLQNCFR